MPNDSKSSPPALSRRALLMTAGTAVAACLGVAAAPARAQPNQSDISCATLIPQRSSKEQARHASNNNSYRNCGNCRFFLSPDQCVVVEGQTTPDSSCSLWAQRGGQIGCKPDQAIRL